MTDTERIVVALNLIIEFGGYDGAHHKDWVLDQVVRALLTAKEYKELRRNVGKGWEEGIAP